MQCAIKLNCPVRLNLTVRAINFQFVYLLMKNLQSFIKELAVNKLLQEDTLEVDPHSEAILVFVQSRGYQVTLAEVDDVLKDILWLCRVGDDIDHA